MESLIVFYLIVWEPLGYALAFLGGLAEGDTSLFVFSFLASQGFFKIWLVIATNFLGAVVGDSLLFFLGRKMKNKDNRFIHRIEKIARPFDHHIEKKLVRSLIISKFTYGIHKPVMIRAGMLNIRYKNYIINDIIAILIWASVIGGAGYFSGLFFYLIKEYVHYAEIGILISLVLLYFASRLVTKYSIKKI